MENSPVSGHSIRRRSGWSGPFGIYTDWRLLAPRIGGRGSITASGRAASKVPYAFLPVEGEGLHQIPVGPVHAGIIEPGHFRFTANGEFTWCGWKSGSAMCTRASSR